MTHDPTQPADHVARIMSEWRRERPDLDVSPQGVIGRLHRLANALTEELVAVYGRFGLAEGEFDVLATLRRAGAPYERTPGDLAASTMVTSGAMTKRIDRLEQRGLVTRRASDTDGRGRVIALTPEGRRLIDEVMTAHIANEHRLLGAIDDRDRRALENALTRWLAAFEAPATG
ncbi:DNA-binding MarR family transcriptional regulator [Agromyces flavus]|uniref:DNA-binding MarR family transcriptional regulator n=1 Tax=Agromyces flavus TaxID=589382 RepID=A0A1H1SHR5_9MICO|nr:MarR family transcriptional regulator [Agromyces flavus]MCP2369025.1 DNA-binding MarR family transcriptional regulator [Agromyces flavus]GGI48480.1 transcriptional regulator [Agromyces flavus]SDS47525.1 DNA-binding transcriptional regulator, MarR family [Agromyces flavus]